MLEKNLDLPTPALAALAMLWVAGACSSPVGNPAGGAGSPATAGSAGAAMSGGSGGASVTGGSSAAGGQTTGGTGGNTAGSSGTAQGGGNAAGAPAGGGGASGGGGGSGGGAGGGVGLPDKAYVYLGGAQSGMGTVALYSLTYATGELTLVKSVTAGQNGSFLAVDAPGHALYVADDSGKRVRRLSLDPTTWVPATGNDQASSGEPVHISVTADGKFVLTAQYNQGTIEAFSVTGGMLGASLGSQAACGQSHEVVLAPQQDYVFVPCKADDKINRYKFDKATGALSAPTPTATAAGAGPRHLAFAPNGQFAYLVTELSSSVYAYSYAAGALTELQRISALPDGFSGTSAGAEIVVSPSGKDVYASNRPNGQDGTLAQFRVGADGKLTANGVQSTGGRTPRSFAIDPTGRFVIAGNVDSSSVAVLAVDAATGKLGTAKVVNVALSPWFVGIVTP